MSDGTGLGERLSESELCPDDLLADQEAAFARDVARLLDRRAEFVEVACPACGGGDQLPGFSKMGFAWSRCGGCRTIYMTPRPSPEVMGAYYADSENYRIWAELIFPASEETRRRKIHEPWLERVVGLCERHAVATGRLVEIGPGFGTFSSVATGSGAFDEVIAVEPTPELAEACRHRGVKVLEKRVEEVGDDLDGADVVVSFETIEHLFEPADLVRQCARMLGPGGLLVLSAPNGEGFDIATLGAGSIAVDPEHVNLFNPDSLTVLLERFGFEVVEVGTPGRLDAELVREAALDGRIDLADQPFLRRVLVDEWDTLGWPFQQFLADGGLSSHMWLAARRSS